LKALISFKEKIKLYSSKGGTVLPKALEAKVTGKQWTLPKELFDSAV
jgi:hypothetical protein